MDEKELQIYNKGIEEGRKHITPSKESRETFHKLDNTIVIMQKDIEQIKSSLEDIKCFIKQADQKYASKDTERNLKRLNWIVITALVIALLGVILKDI